MSVNGYVEWTHLFKELFKIYEKDNINENKKNFIFILLENVSTYDQPSENVDISESLDTMSFLQRRHCA